MLMVSDAFRFIIPVLVLCILAAMLGLPFIALLFFVVAVCIGLFFRNPRRAVPDIPGCIVSPADGRVIQISSSPDGDQTIGIFMSVFNVHVNRSPIRGQLESLEYRRGKFKPAYADEAPSVNEQNTLTIAGEGMKVVVRQIAGVIARRVVCWKRPGDSLRRGERIGLIRFGSRVDVVLPREVNVKVHVGDRVRGGSSIIGEHA